MCWFCPAFVAALTQPDTVEWCTPNALAVSLKVCSSAKRRTRAFNLHRDRSPSRRCRAITLRQLVSSEEGDGEEEDSRLKELDDGDARPKAAVAGGGTKFWRKSSAFIWGRFLRLKDN